VKKRLFFIVDDYLPYSIKVAAQMMHELAVEFVSNSYEITVLTPRSEQDELLVEQYLDGVRVLFFKSGKIKNIGKVKRTINESLLPFRALKAVRKHMKQYKYDGILYYSPSIFWGALIHKLRKKWKCPSYLVLRDVFPQWTVDNGILSKKSLAYWYFKFIEWNNYRAADRIAVMSPSNLRYFEKRKFEMSRFEILYNWSKLEKEESLKTCFRTELGLDGKIVFFYGGNIGHAQKMTNLVNLAKKLSKFNNVHFLFVGKGDEVELVLNEKCKYNLQNITYLPSVDQKTYFAMLNEFDVGLFSLHPNHKTNNFPGKLLGYMLYMKPILGCVNKGNDLKDIINTNNAGIVVDSDDDQGLSKAAIKLLQSEKLRKNMGINGEKLLKSRFSVTNAYKQTSQFFIDHQNNE